MEGPYDYVTANEEQREQMAKLRAAYKELQSVLDVLTPGRAKSLAATKLEESAMWANKAITHG